MYLLRPFSLSLFYDDSLHTLCTLPCSYITVAPVLDEFASSGYHVDTSPTVLTLRFKLRGCGGSQRIARSCRGIYRLGDMSHRVPRDDRMRLFMSLVRMHHIRSETKFKRLKAFAESAKISGLAKKGQPGVLVFDGEKEAIRTFLSNARSLRYLNFHHVDTVPMPLYISQRLADGRAGLHDVNDMAELVRRLDELTMKEWFRHNMGMGKGP